MNEDYVALDVVFVNGQGYIGMNSSCWWRSAKNECGRLIVKCKEHTTGMLKTKNQQSMGIRRFYIVLAFITTTEYTVQLVCSMF
jgi:hypothetical protein